MLTSLVADGDIQGTSYLWFLRPLFLGAQPGYALESLWESGQDSIYKYTNPTHIPRIVIQINNSGVFVCLGILFSFLIIMFNFQVFLVALVDS